MLVFIDDLDATAASERDASIFTVPNRRAMVDSALRWSLHRLLRRLELRFKLLAMDVPSPRGGSLSTYSRTADLRELEAEVPRVREACDTVVAVRRANRNTGGGKKQRVFTSHHDFPSARAADIRDRVEHAVIVYDYFAMLWYFTWYTVECEFVIRLGGIRFLIRTGRTECSCERTKGGLNRTVARLLEVMEVPEYQMNSIGTAKISAIGSLVFAYNSHRGFGGFRVIFVCGTRNLYQHLENQTMYRHRVPHPKGKPKVL